MTRRTLLAAAPVAAAATGAAAQTQPSGPWTGDGYIERPCGKLHYATIGEGKPIILLHKLGGWIADWNGVAPLLAAKGRKVIAFDLPGHGDSVMYGKAPWIQTTAEIAAAIKAAIEDMDIGDFDIAGVSLGGCTSIIMAVVWPQAVKHLCLISTSLAAATTRDAIRKQDVERRHLYGPNWEPLPRAHNGAADQFGTMDPKILEWQDMSRAKGGAWVRASERGAGLADIAAFLPRIASPTLMIMADRGPYRAHIPIAEEKIKGVKVVTVANTGSFVNQEKPAETAELIAGFTA